MTNDNNLPPPFDAFAETVGVPDPDLSLERAALLVARSEYPSMDVDAYLGKLDALAAPLIELREEEDALYRCNRLSQHLFDDLEFRGNASEYYDPRNSYLNEVIDRRLGIPITLSLIYIEVGARLGIPLEGIGMPGHFLVRHREVADLYIDPFHGGILLSADECERRLRSVTGYGGPWEATYLQPVSNREFLTRMLRNLYSIYTDDGDIERANRIRDYAGVLIEGRLRQ